MERHASRRPVLVLNFHAEISFMVKLIFSQIGFIMKLILTRLFPGQNLRGRPNKNLEL